MSVLVEGLGILLAFVILGILWCVLPFAPIDVAMWNTIRENKKHNKEGERK